MNRKQKINRMRHNRPQRIRRRSSGTQHIRADASVVGRVSFLRRMFGRDKARAAIQDQASHKRTHHITPNKGKGTMSPSIKTRRAK